METQVAKFVENSKEALLLIMWQDRRTWVIAKKENRISYRNRFGKIKEMQVTDITKVEVNRYARIKVFCEGGKVFLSRNLWEYPGMTDLIAIFLDNKILFEFQDEATEKQFWGMHLNSKMSIW